MLGNPISRVDQTGLVTIDGDCCDMDTTLEDQINNACHVVAFQTNDPELSECILNKYQSAHVTCDGLYCSLGMVGWNNEFCDGNICLSNFPYIGSIGQWGCVLIHEWAHACDWGNFYNQHPPGGGGLPREYDPLECRDFLDP